MIEEPGVLPRLADLVEARRVALGISAGELADLAGLTREGLRKVRAGGPYKSGPPQKTVFGIARALQWAPDWYDRVASGDVPVEVEVDGGGPAGLARRVDAVERQLNAISDRVSATDQKLEEILRRLGGG